MLSLTKQLLNAIGNLIITSKTFKTNFGFF